LKEESPSSHDFKFDVMLKNMEKMVDKLAAAPPAPPPPHPAPRGENQPQVRNLNFRRTQAAQNRRREHKAPKEQQHIVRPPFPESFVDDDANEEEDH